MVLGTLRSCQAPLLDWDLTDGDPDDRPCRGGSEAGGIAIDGPEVGGGEAPETEFGPSYPRHPARPDPTPAWGAVGRSGIA